MISYCLYKYFSDDMFGYSDYSDLILCIILMPFSIILDIIFLIFQPIFYIIVKKYEQDNI